MRLSPSGRIRSFSSALPQLRLARPSATMLAKTESSPRARRVQNPTLFVCDLQENFRHAIWEFDKVILTTQKLLRAASFLNIPVHVTTQNQARLGGIAAELRVHLDTLSTLQAEVDKTRFSMWVPPIPSDLPTPSCVALAGIESHICITQTALDLLAAGHRVYVLADAVSSCRKAEIGVALARLRAEGAVVTTSESWLYEVVGDAAEPGFKELVRLVKDTGEDTRRALKALIGEDGGGGSVMGGKI